MRIQVPLLVCLSLSAACDRKPTKVVNIPYCKVLPGEARASFARTFRFAYRAGNGWGTGPFMGLDGTAGIGTLDSVKASTMLFTIVQCPTGSAPGGVTVEELNEAHAPELCQGQQVLFHGTLTRRLDERASRKGYAGVLELPTFDASCARGTLARTSVDDLL